MADSKATFSSIPILVLLLFSVTSCHFVRSIYWNTTDLHDYQKFPADTIQSSLKPWSFAELQNSSQYLLNSDQEKRIELFSFDRLLFENKTVAFLIIRNDTLLYERYFQGYTRNSIIPSFSIAKSIVAALVGIAIKDGYIQSINQQLKDFLPLLPDSLISEISLKDLLEMRSGLDFNESYQNPFSKVAKFYYGLDLKKYVYQLKTAEKPGQTYQYQSANTQFLAMVLERVTGKPLSQYFQEKIWTLTGTENLASWSYDSKEKHEVKAFCCFNARVLDYAKFGRLILNDGNWNGQEIIPSSWIKESLTIQNDSRDGNNFPYTYSWRITKDGDYFAKGVGGQYLYLCPHYNMIILRFGSKNGQISWVDFMEGICHPEEKLSQD